jgi:protein-L-isoaspartate(D-aspartate) O-methyltransferase
MRLILALRRIGLTDARLLAAIERTPRADFVAPHLEALSWDDVTLPFAEGQHLPKPSDAARFLQALAPRVSDRVLEIGAGSGWQSAVLSRLCADVVTLERRRSLARAAAEQLASLGFSSVRVHCADGAIGWPEEAPYDRIVINTAIHTARPALLDQLKPGGVLVAPVGEGPEQRLTRVRLNPDQTLDIQDCGPVRYPPIEVGVED